MPAVSRIADAATREIPDFISADAHCVLDYFLAGTFAFGGVILARKSPRAALASCLCGSFLFGLTMMTNFPRSERKPLSLRKHANTEMGMAGLIALLPEVLRLPRGASRFFSVQAGLVTAISNLTCFQRPDLLR